MGQPSSGVEAVEHKPSVAQEALSNEQAAGAGSSKITMTIAVDEVVEGAASVGKTMTSPNASATPL